MSDEVGGNGSQPASPSSAGLTGTLAPETAGSLLRKARQAQGLHIAALANAIKVAPRKLELLEADRHDELPDATFIRALAQAVCRALKIDSAPVLVLLPKPSGWTPAIAAPSLNTPFRDRPSHSDPVPSRRWFSIAKWAPLLVLTAAAAVYLWPTGWSDDWLDGTIVKPAAPVLQPAPAAAVDAPDASVPGPTAAEAAVETDRDAPLFPADTASGVVIIAPAEPVASANAADAVQAGDAVASAAAPAAGAVDPLIELRATAPSWVEIVDARSSVLLARVLSTGEVIRLNGVVPLRVRVGNASATDLRFRGKPVDLMASTRDNVARLELK